MSEYDYTDVNTGEDYTDSQMEDVFQDWLDDFHGQVDIAGYSMSAGRVLREVDYTAFREEFNNWVDAADHLDEWSEDHPWLDEDEDGPVCEDCGEDMDQNEVTEALADHGRLFCQSCEEDYEVE